jgi:FecR protein
MFRPIRFAVLLAGVTLAFSALAQPAPDEAPPPGQDGQDGQSGPVADPPTRVARLSFIRGDVSFVPAGENDWVEAQLNRPLITGDKLWTDKNSRSELEIGSSTMRIDQDTSFDFLNLDDKTAQVELTQGTLNLRVRRLYDDQSYEIDTPTLAFVVNRVGEYRIDVAPDGQGSIVTVLHGGGDAYGEGGARFRVEEGQSVKFNDPQLQNYESNNLPPADDFDRFSAERDGRWDHAKSRQYVSEEVIGYQDLDDNGEWSDAPEYGNVWYPTTVAVGWSPYHNGHWGWVGAYGWSWVDDAPWGFAPFHYGRWAYIGNRWGWCPGPIAVRPVYAPALVAFIGGGVGVSIGFGSGPVGWFPLGPRDVYFPGYRVSHNYFTNINISNSRGFNNVTVNNYYGGYARGNVNYAQINYSNRGVAGAVVAVPAAAFVGSRPVGGAAIRVNEQTFANSRVSGFAAVAPTRASLGPATAARSLPPAALANRQIVAATKPPAPTASFAQRQTLLQKNPGQPLAQSQLRGPVAAAGPGAIRSGAGQPNLRVVTNGGTPVHTAAPPLPAHPGAANAATAHIAPTGGPAATRVVPAVQSNNTAVQSTGVAHGPATSTAGPAANSHLDSARFAHPGANTVTNGNGNSQTGRPATTTTQSVQHIPSTSTNTGQMMSPGTHVAPISHVTPTPTTTPGSSTVGPKTTNTVGNTRDSGYAAHNAVTPQNNPQIHQVTPTNQYHGPAATQATPQTYQRPVTVQHTPSPPPPPPHVSTPPPPPPRVVTPPPQIHAAPVVNKPPPPKDKKDDDKKHGGRD